jgi:hypothetical protein
MNQVSLVEAFEKTNGEDSQSPTQCKWCEIFRDLEFMTCPNCGFYFQGNKQTKRSARWSI